MKNVYSVLAVELITAAKGFRFPAALKSSPVLEGMGGYFPEASAVYGVRPASTRGPGQGRELLYDNGYRVMMRTSKFQLILGRPVFAVSVSIVAQPFNSKPDAQFQVDQRKGCASLTVNITNLLAGNCTAGRPRCMWSSFQQRYVCTGRPRVRCCAGERPT